MPQSRSRNAPTAKSQYTTFGRNAPVILLLSKHVKTLHFIIDKLYIYIIYNTIIDITTLNV